MPVAASGNPLSSLLGLGSTRSVMNNPVENAGVVLLELLGLNKPADAISQLMPGMYVGKGAKGWGKMEGKFSNLADKMERAEISDEGARLTGKALGELEDVLHHPELYKAYPEMRNDVLTTILGARKGANQGTYKTLAEPIEFRGRPYSESIEVESSDKLGSLLHEIQHAIQEREGFAGGGSPEKELVNINWEPYKELLTAQELALKGRNEAITTKQKKYYDDLLNTVRDEMQRVKGKLSIENYKRLAGEIEARDTSFRQLLDDRMRRENMPYESQGIPLSEWIVRMR